MQTEKYFYFSDPSDAELSYILSMDRLYIATVKRILLTLPIYRCMKPCKASDRAPPKAIKVAEKSEREREIWRLQCSCVLLF